MTIPHDRAAVPGPGTQQRTAVGRVRRIGFLSARIAGTDGVSLETAKWAAALERLGHECFFVAGELERQDEHAYRIEEAAFTHPQIARIQAESFVRPRRSAELTTAIRQASDRLRIALHRCQDALKLDLWIAENCLAMPMNLPLGLAFTEFLAETELPCIAHHHDFYWERERFAGSAVGDYLHAAFPPNLSNIHHVVINSVARGQLSHRLGVAAELIPNVMDFEHPPPPPDEFASTFRRDIGIADDEWLILQPTRVVSRKKIDLAIELVAFLRDPRARLVVTHAWSDEGDGYIESLREYAELIGVTVKYVAEWVGQERRPPDPPRRTHKRYVIDDVYPHADLVTYPSEYEGFGNAFLEAIYFGRPIVCNRYSIYRTDIEPKGFDVIALDGFVSREAVAKVRRVLADRDYRRAMTERNYELGRCFFSYRVLQTRLEALLTEIGGAACDAP